jgi:hypothetical protein
MKVRKAIAILLGVVALLLVALAGFSLYFYRYSRYSTIFRAQSHVAISRALEQRLDKQAEFVPPPGGVSDDQLARFLSVEREVERIAATRERELRQAADELDRLSTQPGGLTVLLALKVIGEVGAVFRDAKQAQVAAMNAATFSREEFEWVRRHSYAGAGIEWSQLDLGGLITFEDVQEAITVRRHDPPVSVAADARLREHADALRRWRPFAFFGF